MNSIMLHVGDAIGSRGGAVSAEIPATFTQQYSAHFA
jgi:hypothetical protein